MLIQYQQTNLLTALAMYLAVIGTFIGLSRLVLMIVRKYILKITQDIEKTDVVIRSIKKPTTVTISLIGIYIVLLEISLPEQYIHYINTIFYTVWTITIAISIYKLTDLLISIELLKRLPRSNVEVIRKVVKWVTVLTVVLVLLGISGLLRSIISIVMLVIGTIIFLAFAGWSIIGNITAGIVLMVWKPFQIGDTIEIIPENIAGKVEDITLMFIKIRTVKGEEIYIPNTLVIQRFIKNMKPNYESET